MNEDFWKKVGLPPGEVATFDQYQAAADDALEQVLDNLQVMYDSGMMPPAFVLGISVLADAGIDPGGDHPIVPVVMAGTLALYKLFKLKVEPEFPVQDPFTGEDGGGRPE